MITVNAVESTRLELQAQLDGARTQAERNRYGQFATPPGLATEMLTYARTLLPPETAIRFLDPALGTGSFYSALLGVFSRSQIARAVGYEIDPHYGQAARQVWATEALTINITDFTRVAPPATEADKSNLLICNPPYVRHHHIPGAEKGRLRDLAAQAVGMHLSGLAGLYCYFLGLAHAWLARSGLAGWLIPSEFMDVNYGRQVKEYLLTRVTLLRVHRFDPHDMQFDDALVSSAVVWLRNTAPPDDHQVEFTYGGTLLAPRLSQYIPAATLRGTTKWTGVSATRRSGDYAGLKLSTFFKIKRGLATGANDFFILTPEQIIEHQLPGEFLTPILPSPRYVPVDEVAADGQGAPLLQHKLLLLRCNLPAALVQDRYPTLWNYLQRGVEAGISERYLCKHRSPWYLQEERPPAMLLCTYMGRQGASARRPLRFILNYSQATAANVYLMLYPKPALGPALQAKPALLRALWQALNKITPEVLTGEGRVYGGGLHKIEPEELANVPADDLLTEVPELGDYCIEQASFFP